MNTLFAVAESWCAEDSAVNSFDELLKWISDRNRETAVDIKKISLDECSPWFFDAAEGCIRNRDRSFFQIFGIKGEGVSQPVILQDEIGYLGILCKEIGGVLHFLMQAKIEPGNVNCVQISPTIQATKSNFTQKHGGKKPPYLDFFLNAQNYEIVVDQIQSEQSSRFFKKRNRNIIIKVDGEVEVLPSHRWMTLGQIKRLMRHDNLVNMDTRTVLSCIPFCKAALTKEETRVLREKFSDKALFASLFEGDGQNHLPQIYHFLNDRKMFAEGAPAICSLAELDDWQMYEGELACKHDYPFKVVFCDIAIEGREVRRWTQPLFQAMGVATFGLVCFVDDGKLKVIVKACEETGCFDLIELGPTIQREAVAREKKDDPITRFFDRRLKDREGIVFDHLLSEEGGRFFHEQNRNVLVRADKNDLPPLPEGYFAVDLKTLNELVQVNNTLNIQLRNLLSLLEA